MGTEDRTLIVRLSGMHLGMLSFLAASGKEAPEGLVDWESSFLNSNLLGRGQVQSTWI